MRSSRTPEKAKLARPRHLVVPDLGVGAGLRVPHYGTLLEQWPEMAFFEAISENYFGGGKPRYHLERIAERYPLVLHGVSLGIGGPSEPDREQLTSLRELARRLRVPWVSDHLCWTGPSGAHLHDLLPLPQTHAVARRIAARARMIQDFLEVPFALENTSSYVTFAQSELSEWEFISEVCEGGDVGLLLDVNNIYVSAFNNDFGALEFLRGVPHERVLQIHVAGHTHFGTHIIDTHVGRAPPPVIELYREAIRLCGPISTLLEWDQDIPEFSVLAEEVGQLAEVRRQALAPNAPPLEADVMTHASEPSLSSAAAAVHGGAAGSLSAWATEPGRATPAEGGS